MKESNKLKSRIFNTKNFWNCILILIGSLFLIGGLGLETNFVQHAGVLVGILLLLLSGAWNKKILFPRGSHLYLIFIILFGLSLFWSKDIQISYEYLILFFSGGLFWVSFYNLRKELSGKFDTLVIILGLIFGVLFIGSLLFDLDMINSRSLYLQTSGYRNHNHLGDLWAVVMLLAGYYLIKTRKYLYWPIIFLGVYFLATSLSRAAYLSLFLGALYLFAKQGWLNKYKKAVQIMVLVFITLFVYAGAQKTTLLSRPFLFQGVMGIMHNPLGVGVGNFSIISMDSANHLWGMVGFSSLAHNIILEILTGMGILGFVFIAWLVFIFKEIWSNKCKDEEILYRAVFIILGVNFLFSTTYFIPTMLWLWFGYLGLLMKNEGV